MPDLHPYVLDFSQVGAGDIAVVGGKCASLGELFLVKRGIISISLNPDSVIQTTHHILETEKALKAKASGITEN